MYESYAKSKGRSGQLEPLLSSREWSGWSHEQNTAKDPKSNLLRRAQVIGRFYPVGILGLQYLEMPIDSSHAFLIRLWSQAVVLIEIMAPLACLALASKVTDPQDQVTM